MLPGEEEGQKLRSLKCHSEREVHVFLTPTVGSVSFSRTGSQLTGETILLMTILPTGSVFSNYFLFNKDVGSWKNKNKQTICNL